jgi:hypothetical protein
LCESSHGAAVDAPGQAPPDHGVKVASYGDGRGTELEGELGGLHGAVVAEPVEDESLALARE